MAWGEYSVKRILGHSGCQDGEGALQEVKFLIEWDGVDKDGNPYPPSWEDFLDVGIPLIAGYTHCMAMGYPRFAQPKPDGYVYLYADNWAYPHIPRSSVTIPTAGKPAFVTQTPANKPNTAAHKLESTPMKSQDSIKEFEATPTKFESSIEKFERTPAQSEDDIKKPGGAATTTKPVAHKA